MPVISASSVQRWTASDSVRIIGESTDTVLVSFSDSASTWNYTVDKSRWVITHIRKFTMYEGYETPGYDGLYAYADSSGVWALQSIAFAGDTAFKSGGYRFRDIRINAALNDSLFAIAVKNPMARGQKAGAEILVYARPEGVFFKLSGVSAQSRMVTISDLRGKLIHKSELSSAGDRFFWNGLSQSATRVPRGTYLLRLYQNGSMRTARFTW